MFDGELSSWQVQPFTDERDNLVFVAEPHVVHRPEGLVEVEPAPVLPAADLSGGGVGRHVPLPDPGAVNMHGTPVDGQVALHPSTTVVPVRHRVLREMGRLLAPVPQRTETFRLVGESRREPLLRIVHADNPRLVVVADDLHASEFDRHLMVCACDPMRAPWKSLPTGPVLTAEVRDFVDGVRVLFDLATLGDELPGAHVDVLLLEDQRGATEPIALPIVPDQRGLPQPIEKRRAPGSRVDPPFFVIQCDPGVLLNHRSTFLPES